MSRDCCSWSGVKCDEMTGLSCSGLVGKIDSNNSLFQLTHLQRLDLSNNDFSNSHISPQFGRFSSLTYLDLSDSYFSGQIPSEISHLYKLQSLLLSTSYNTVQRLAAHDFRLLLHNLTLLRVLDLSGVSISSTIPLNFSSHFTTLVLGHSELYGVIPESIFHLPKLKILDLSINYQLNGYFPKTKWNSSASLTDLNLQGVNFSGYLPESLGYLTSLNNLFLIFCNIWGPIPESLSNLTRIEYMFLAGNFLNGTIPSSIFSLPSLTDLELSNNHFSGKLEDIKSNSLLSIDLGNNQLQGHLPESIQNLVNLTTLDLSFNNFSGSVDLAACEVKELEFLRSAKKLEHLDLSNNKLQGRFPDWASSNWMFSLNSLNLSHNMLTSVDLTPFQSLKTIDLQSNSLQGSLSMPPNSTTYFFISENNLSGEIPSSICNLTSLVMLDLARNNLKGAILQCLGNISSLQVLDMHHNSLTGTIPTTFRFGSSLRSLNLHGNKLEGKIPQSLANCKELHVLDLGDNHLIDIFPMWLGTLPKVQVLSLRSNELHGSIRTPTIENIFPNLQMLDLSSNAFTENLPTGLFQHLKAMRTIDQTMNAPHYEGTDGYYQDSVAVVSKGFEREIGVFLKEINFRPLRTIHMKVMMDYVDSHFQKAVVMIQYQRQNTVSGLDDEESNSEFLNNFWKGALMGYGSGLCIGLSIIYFMISTGKPMWLARIIVELEHKIMMGRRKKQRRQRNYRKRNNQL
ncbi:hypothetical protein MTR67_049922 [Solanum verrucosum]|uniref:Uncharacterized protein n=1 Tax=Solanum verrucosum TaxID=315347 RepID=A0AAF0ZXV5_SOLVR|nr:hypothetical protein MTR67_049922 [Solanum verrucosum]